MTSEQRLAYLIRKSHTGPWTKPWVRELKRRRWNQIKRTRKLGKCWVCGKKANVGHHVRPLSRGGWYGWSNVVYLDNKCHKKVHGWL